MGEIWFFLQFFEDLDLPGEVFGVVAAEGVFVGGPAEPVGVAPQLIGEVGVVVLQRILLHVLVGVGGPAALRKVASRVPVSRPHVLVVPAVSRKVRRVGTQLRTWPSALEQVLGHWALYPIAGLAGESLEVGGADVEVRALEAAVFLIAVDEVGDLLLREEAALVDGVLGEVRPDNVEPAEVAAAVALAAHAALLVMAEVALLQLPRSPPEALLLGEALLVVVPAALRLREVVGGVEGLHFGARAAPEAQLGLEGWFLGGPVALRERAHGNSNNFIPVRG